ncbi:long-chain fatty acid--CoA ligase [Virgibacillus sp. MSP4-1]|uniref:class I adenylate-forming enzyme family protein n=1 Tax=Virgibacillus sp. MSP4-1 TaxID=2700081 RepID=UPI0005C471F6|nr:AMP-binding protein [Virgibacillus sp. MSP4-1]QHS23423.1 long-chain fatty acid--CoA ligase [Virgibacillus sp. MSP4-1]
MGNGTNNQIYDLNMPKSLNYPNVSVGAILKGSANRFRDRVAYIYRDHEITYWEVYCKSLRFANALRKLGVDKGTVVSTHLPTCPQYIIAYYGIILCGATYSPINPYFKAHDVEYQLNDSDTEVVITYETFAQTIQQVYDNTKLKKVIVSGDREMFTEDNQIDTSIYGENWYSFQALQADSTEEELNIAIDPKNDLVQIAYTGGTTGRPKGVMNTHMNLVSSMIQTAAWGYGCLAHVEDDGGLVLEPVEKDKEVYLSKYASLPGTTVGLSPSPLFHVSGVFSCIVYPYFLGKTTVLIDRFNPKEFLSLIEKFGVTDIAGAPAMWNVLCRHPDVKNFDFSTVKSVGSGSAPLAKEQMKLLRKTFPNAIIGEGYGLTEATSSVSNTVLIRSGLQKIGTVGPPLFDTEVKIIAIDGSSEAPLPNGKTGEICVRGPQVMKGYYNKPKQTEETLRGGWLHTGDIGIIDEDGLLSIVDRKKDMLIYNGYNVYPSKIEDLLFQHPAVSNVAVIGKPHSNTGEIPKAFVTLKQDGIATEKELMEYVNEQVVHYSKIRELEIVEELPHTAAGKILKRKLLDMEKEKMGL